jgi:2-haloacid dehalogenase
VAQAFRAAGVPGNADELADEWRSRYWPLLRDVNDGARPWANFDEHHLLTLGELLGERGLELPAEEQQRLVSAWHRLEPWPDVRTGLEQLRRVRITAALSNGHTALLVDLARHADLRLDCLISAELARAYKPAAEVYLTAARLLALEPAELMLVAAHPLDLKGARGAGLKTAFVDRPLEYGPGSPARSDPDADVSVGDLHELVAHLG